MPEVLPPGISIASFSEGYRKYFEVVPATTPELKWHNFHLRHEVYAEELGWEPRRADGVATDEYDDHSLHCLVRAVATHAFVGGARLVLPDPEHPAAPLPFETACGATLDRDIVDTAAIDRSRIAEMSRLAVAAGYRRRPGDAGQAFIIDDDFGIAPRVRLPYLTLGLYLGLIALARMRGIRTLFMLTEPRLAQSVAHLGIEVVPIGAATKHDDERFPSMLSIDGVVAGLAPYVRPFFDTIADDIERALRTPV